MAISHQTASEFILESQRASLTSWLSKCQLVSDDELSHLPEQIRFGQNVFELLSSAGIACHQLGHLSVGLPTDSFATAAANLGCFWFPAGLPLASTFGKSIHVASSRLSQKLDVFDSWFDAIRTTATRLDPAENFFVTADGTTTDTFVRRIGDLFGFCVAEFRRAPAQVSPKWAECILAQSHSKMQQGNQIVISIDFNDSDSIERPNKNMPIDETLITIAKEVRLLSVRKGGNIHQAALDRLTQRPRSDTRLLIDTRLTHNSVKDDFVSQGATCWWLYHDLGDRQTSFPAIKSAKNEIKTEKNYSNSARFEAPLLDLNEIKPERFLLHWTRRRVGPWPDQTDQEYLDDLIFQANRRNHCEIAAVARILASRKIMATNQLTRDNQPVVCFSNLPLTELVDRKVFRRHLSRWDFQPFGIAIDREVLSELGAKAVIYGDEAKWEQLEEIKRPYFQLAVSLTSQIDWREENEWRLIGDLDLNLIDSNSAVVFVQSADEAEAVSSISRWPIVMLNPDA